MWLPPPVPVCRPSSMNFSVPSRELPGLVVERRRVVDQFVPVRRRLHVDLDHARVGRDLEVLQAVVVRRRVAFDRHRKLRFGGRVFDGGDQVEIILDARPRAA